MADWKSLLLAAALGGGRVRQPSQPLELPALFNCGGTEEIKVEEKFVNVPPPKQGPLFLRMCILCAHDLAAGNLFVRQGYVAFSSLNNFTV